MFVTVNFKNNFCIWIKSRHVILFKKITCLKIDFINPFFRNDIFL